MVNCGRLSASAALVLGYGLVSGLLALVVGLATVALLGGGGPVQLLASGGAAIGIGCVAPMLYTRLLRPEGEERRTVSVRRSGGAARLDRQRP
jgi:hypothetical protein